MKNSLFLYRSNYKKKKIKAVLGKKKHPDLEVTERTVRNELSRFVYVAVLPKEEVPPSSYPKS